MRAVILALVAAGVASSALPGLGVNVHTDTLTVARSELFDRMSSMGARWIRDGVPFYLVQPRGPNHVNESAIDSFREVINDATRAGLRTLMIGDQAADWAGGRSGVSDPQAYGAYMGLLARRYKGSGPGGSSPAFEITNEPNGIYEGQYWAAPADYAHAACAAYRAIKKADAKAVVLGGSLDVTGWREWLKASLDAGLADCFDALSAHPYAGPEVLHAIRRMVTAYGRSNVSIWVTEFGSSTCSNADLGCIGPKAQASEIVDMVKDLSANYPWVPEAMVYEAIDEPSVEGASSERHFGLWTSSFIAKPAVASLRKLYQTHTARSPNMGSRAYGNSKLLQGVASFWSALSMVVTRRPN